MTHRTITTVATIIMLGCGTALAQASRSDAQAADARATRAGAGERRGDLRDLARLQSMASRLDMARANDDEKALKAVNAQIRQAVLGELETVRAEEKRAKAELERRAREDGSGMPELEMSIMADSAPAEPGAQAPADRRDGSVAAKTQQRRVEIAEQLRRGGFSTEPANVDKERALLGELIVLARVDAAQAARATREDGAAPSADRD